MDGNARGNPQSWAKENRGTDRIKPFPPLPSAAVGRAAAAPGTLSFPGTLGGERLAVEELTSRESDVLQCLSGGLSTSAIARRLLIAPVTVRNHVQSILQKFDVHTRLAAVVYAIRHNRL